MLSRALLVALASAPLALAAQVFPPPPVNQVTFDASATTEVPSDTVVVTLFTEEQGPDPADLAARANQRLEQALATAKATPGVDARSGAYQTQPLYDRANQITGWRVRAELILESRDFRAASALAGRIAPAMKLAAMQFSLSRAAREKAEAALMTAALEKYRTKADAIAKSLGFPGYTLGQIAVRGDAPIAQPVQYRGMAVAMADAGAAPPPMEGGRNTVTVVVSGSVILGPAKP